MLKLYWSFESSIDPYTCISIRSYGDVPLHFYIKYLNEILRKYSKNIVEIEEMSKLEDGTYVCMIKLINIENFDYPKYIKK
jgi:hypothetical protein